MRFDGRLKSWNGERGFGFIEPTLGGDDVFVHISAVPASLRPPRIGQPFTFEVELDRRGKKRAAHVGSPRSRSTAPRRRPAVGAPWSTASRLAVPLFVVVFVAVFVVVAVVWRVSIWVALDYVLMSVASVVAYAVDKSAAGSGGWRVSEQSLLLLGLVGGWPGAIVAQQLFRHKTRKASFRSAFRRTVAINVAGFIAFHSPLIAAWRA